MYPIGVREAALALLESGSSLSFVSRRTGVSRAALREWRDQGIRPGRSTTGCFLCESGGPESPPSYSGLLGYYLGDGCLSRARTSHCLRVSCDARFPGIVQDVSRLVEGVHVGGRVCLVKAPGVLVVQNTWKHWPCLFPQHGPGRKHERTLVLEPWQRSIVEEHPAEFLRGLFHSDGCRTANWATRTVRGEVRRYEYPRWQFVNNSDDIRQWCTEALDRLEIPWRQNSWKCISVSTAAGVARLDELIGPKT